MIRNLCVALPLAFCIGLASAAEPYTPSSADTVLLQRTPGAAKALRAARGVTAASDPAQVAVSVVAAIAEARKSGDPRYYGQAQALLGSAWTAPAPPLRLRLLRATLLQQRHDFAGALRDLDAVLAEDPRNAEAHLIRANIRLVQGEPKRARSDCAALITEASLLVTATCIGAVGGLSGQAATGLAAIEQALARDTQAPLALQLWAHTQAAEIAERLGEVPRATEHFATALAAASAAKENDAYLKAAYADFLLEQKRPEEVRELLAAETDFDPLLLRLAIAEQRLAPGNAASRQHLKELLARFELGQQRGDASHHREQAMAALHLQGDAKAALDVAQRNWAEQREPADALILLQAALAARDKAAAQPVLAWLSETRLEDVRILPLVKQIEALP